MATTLGVLLIELKAKTDAFEKGMKSAKDLSFTTSSEIVGSLERIGKSLLNLRFNNFDQAGKSLGMIGGIAAATGAALATSVIAVAVETSNKMVEMGHNAEKAGMGIQTFTEFAYAAKRSGVDVETFTNAMSKLAKNALAAAQGNAQLQRAFQLAGTSATDANGRLRPTGDILTDIIKKYETLSDRTLKAGLSQQVFGKGGASVIPVLEKGTAKIEEYKKQAQQLGIAFDENTLQAAMRFKGGLAELKGASEGATIQFTAGLLPALNNIFDSMTKVTGKASAMHDFGEGVGEVFKQLAEWVYEAAYALEYWKIKSDEFKSAPNKNQIVGTSIGLSNPASGAAALQAAGALDQSLTAEEKKHFYDTKSYDPFQERLEEASRKLQERLDRLNAPPTTGKSGAEGGGTPGLNPDAKNFAAEEIQKLKEKAQATLALSAAQLQGEDAVRATTAANQADAVILQIATKASKEHKTALDAEIVAAQKKYGSFVSLLTALGQEATRSEAFNKSIVDQTRDAQISADGHQRLAEAIMQGGDAVTKANILNQIDAAIRKAGIKLTQEQIDKLNELKQSKIDEASKIASQAYAQEIFNLQGAAKATQLLIDAQGRGIEESIAANAEIQVENFERQNNITLIGKQREELLKYYKAKGLADQVKSTGDQLTQEYDPRAVYASRLNEINLAVANNKNLTVYAEAAKRDAYLQEQEALDQVAMKTQKGAAGAQVALRQWLRESQDWAKTMHEATSMVLQGFDNGFRNAFHDVLMGTKSVGQAFVEMGRTMVESVVNALGLILAKWVETAAIMAVMKLFGINIKDEDPMTKAQKQIAANAATAQSYAGLSAAEEFAYALAESMGDVAYAAEMSAVAFAIGEGYAAMAAFDNGGIMPKTGIALVHQDEGVLTAPVTKMLKNMATSPRYNSPSPTSGGRANYGGDTHIHYTAVVQAIDSTDMQQKLSEHGDHIRGLVKSGNRNRGFEEAYV